MSTQAMGWLLRNHGAPLIPPSWVGPWRAWGVDAIDLAKGEEAASNAALSFARKVATVVAKNSKAFAEA